MITLTLDLIFKCQTARKGWTNATLEALGLQPHDKTTGGPRRLVGRQLTEEDGQRAIDGARAASRARCELSKSLEPRPTMELQPPAGGDSKPLAVARSSE